ncbi:MAG: zf-HC2 domain-containing protein [Acidobacteriota bacterium]|nr:zf-HC2 domain-containing protein [Acidobacteriota bacterium]
MNCDWTEKISMLIDGELGADDARAAEGHLADCAACRRAREDFLLMRREIISYPFEADPVARRRALRKILGVEAAGMGAREASSSAPSRGWRERLGVFALPRLSPALAAAVALLVVGVVIGVVTLRRPERAEVANGTKTGERANVSANGNANATESGAAVVTPAPAASANEQIAKTTPQPPTIERKNVLSGENGASRREVRVVTAPAPGRGADRAAKSGAGASSGEEARQPKIVDRLKLPVTPKLAVDPTELVETEIASLRSKVETTDSDASQHVEQAQRLLRSFRNARVEGEPSASDIAYEKRRSRDLLYRNIVLRREAAARGDVATASLLDSLEPILIDIANLPDRPAQDDVRAITERMRKKNIVAMLQVANGSRMY